MTAATPSSNTLHVGTVTWVPGRHTVTVHTGPASGTPTAAFVLATRQGRLLVATDPTRGPDIPGGHIEPGESAVDAAVRELAEETGLHTTVDQLIPVGAIEIRRASDGPPDRYPPHSTLVVFHLPLTSTADLSAPTDPKMGPASWLAADQLPTCPDAPWTHLARRALRC